MFAYTSYFFLFFFFLARDARKSIVKCEKQNLRNVRTSGDKKLMNFENSTCRQELRITGK